MWFKFAFKATNSVFRLYVERKEGIICAFEWKKEAFHFICEVCKVTLLTNCSLTWVTVTTNYLQPRPQGLLRVQNAGSEKTMANIRSRISRNVGDFDCFKIAAGFVIG